MSLMRTEIPRTMKGIVVVAYIDPGAHSHVIIPGVPHGNPISGVLLENPIAILQQVAGPVELEQTVA